VNPAEKWNAEHPVGTTVTLKKANGTKVKTITLTPATQLTPKVAGIYLSGLVGCYSLDRVTVR